MDKNWNLYLSNLNEKAVTRMDRSGHMQTVAKDDRLEWPDTFSEGPDGAIYISASHINETPPYNEGKDARHSPFSVFKFQPK